MKLKEIMAILMAKQAKEKVIFNFYDKKITFSKECESVSFEEIYQRWRYYESLAEHCTISASMIKELYFTENKDGRRTLHMNGDWVIGDSGHTVTIHG